MAVLIKTGPVLKRDCPDLVVQFCVVTGSQPETAVGGGGPAEGGGGAQRTPSGTGDGQGERGTSSARTGAGECAALQHH